MAENEWDSAKPQAAADWSSLAAAAARHRLLLLHDRNLAAGEAGISGCLVRAVRDVLR